MTHQPGDSGPDRDGLLERRIADRYRVLELLARGGMARVYRAHDERLDRDVAVKILAEPYASDPDFAERFLAEARTAAGLAHTNLVHVYDSGQDGDARYIVMELLTRYRTLRDRLAEDAPLPATEAVELVREILAGLALVHDRGLVHCDVKAANIMVGPGPAKLIDFGIARTPAAAGSEGTSLGSLHAMPPEQLRGEPLSPASDMFAAGVVLYQALTGQVPFDADSPEAMLAAEGEPPAPPSTRRPGIPRRLDEVVAQALDPEPARRFRNARAMAAALESALATPDARVDETDVVAASPAPEAGYVPPLVLPSRGPVRLDAPRRTAAAQRPRRRGGIGPWLLAAVTLVVGLVVVFGLVRAGGSGPGGGGSGSPTATSSASLPAGRVSVPNTIGMTEAEAEDAAKQAHLDWTIKFDTITTGTPGIYDQEPAAGTPVDVGSRFVMYAHRVAN